MMHFITVQSYDVCKWSSTFWPDGHIRFVCTLHYLIIIIVQTYLEVLDVYNTCQVYSVECKSKSKNILLIVDTL